MVKRNLTIFMLLMVILIVFAGCNNLKTEEQLRNKFSETFYYDSLELLETEMCIENEQFCRDLFKCISDDMSKQLSKEDIIMFYSVYIEGDLEGTLKKLNERENNIYLNDIYDQSASKCD